MTPSSDRPDMPAGYGVEPGQTDRLLPWSWAVERLAAARSYWVASTRPDGRPHVMPVWGIWLDDAFHFGTGQTSRKGRNIAANPRVAVHLESGDEVVILEGSLLPMNLADRDLVVHFTAAYAAKYGVTPEPNNPGDIYYTLSPRVALAWREQDFTTSATRWTFDR